jgi:DNA-3-methyladenine glycosylase I
MIEQTKVRCSWTQSNELLIAYHDTEWGVPAHDDRHLFEMINLEGAQAGLSWLTVLRKREAYRQAFDYFAAEKIANYDDAKKQALLQNEGIIRNRLKINAVIENARAFLKVQDETGSFDTYIWSFVDGKPLTNAEEQQATAKSVLMSKCLSKRGFRFVGPTICYAFMQATGMVNDHTPDCFRASMIANEGRA